MAASDRFDAQAASLMMVGFQGHELPAALSRYVEQGAPAGVILFRRNIKNTEQVAGLIRDIRALWPNEGPPPLIAVDQEGGKVRRLRPPECPEFLDLPEARSIARANNPTLTRELGEICARQLAALGFNVDFAPVLDVDSNPANPVIGARSFGADAKAVIQHALAFSEGLSSGGVIPCAKHFPGHGDTDLDSHHALPSLAHDIERLREVELAPFSAAVEAGIPTMMSAHIVFEALDSEWPATLSPHIIPKLLREEIGFDGVVFSDDLEMRAIADHQSAEAIARQGLAASLDIFLVCHELERAGEIRRALSELAQVNEAAADALHRASERVAKLRANAHDHALEPWQGVPLQPEATAAIEALHASLLQDKPGL